MQPYGHYEHYTMLNGKAMAFHSACGTRIYHVGGRGIFPNPTDVMTLKSHFPNQMEDDLSLWALNECLRW